MSAVTYEEMEAKRQEMIASFRDIATAMGHLIRVIEDYTSLSPAHLSRSENPVPPPALAHSASSGTLAPVDGKKERKKKDKKPRDPNAPKRPPSAYILFQNEIRDEIRNSNPGMAYKDVLGIISQKWKDLTENAKKVYEDAYSNAQSQFRVDEQAYKGGDVPPSAIAPPEVFEDSDSSDSSDDSSDEDSTPAVLAPKPTSKATKPPTNSTPLPAPSTLHAAVSTPRTDVKKEKKRKNKEDEAAVAATLTPSGDKKKRSKKAKE